MSFKKVIQNLNYKQIISLVGWFFKHPLFMISTVFATVKTYSISQKEFPNIHGQQNKANAFRHALWNILIAKKCANFSSDEGKVLAWTKRFTHWHEEFSPNKELPKAMDLKNNALGREFYKVVKDKNTNEITSFLLLKLEEAVKVSSVSAMVTSEKMVYLSD